MVQIPEALCPRCVRRSPSSFPCTPPPPTKFSKPTTTSFPLVLLAREPRVWEVEGLGASLASAMADTGARGRGEEPEPVTPPPQQQQHQGEEETQAVDDRRLLRSQYLAVKGLISGRAVLPCETRTDSESPIAVAAVGWV